MVQEGRKGERSPEDFHYGKANAESKFSVFDQGPVSSESFRGGPKNYPVLSLLTVGLFYLS